MDRSDGRPARRSRRAGSHALDDPRRSSTILDALEATRDFYEASLTAAEATIALGNVPDTSDLEAASSNYATATARAAGSRALLLAVTLRPIAADAQTTIIALREAESRAGVTRYGFDEASMLAAFEAEGLLLSLRSSRIPAE